MNSWLLPLMMSIGILQWMLLDLISFDMFLQVFSVGFYLKRSSFMQVPFPKAKPHYFSKVPFPTGCFHDLAGGKHNLFLDRKHSLWESTKMDIAVCCFVFNSFWIAQTADNILCSLFSSLYPITSNKLTSWMIVTPAHDYVLSRWYDLPWLCCAVCFVFLYLASPWFSTFSLMVMVLKTQS